MEKKYSLPKEFAEKWVAALRSGDYKQADQKYYDRSTDCYCANGVGYKIQGAIFNENGTINSSGPRLIQIPMSLWEEVVYLNDTNGRTFSEIADWIEANVEFTESGAIHE